MKPVIPQPVIAAIAEIVSDRETHATLESLLMHAGAPGDPPDQNKLAKTMTWLRRVNRDHAEPLTVLGLVIEPYLDAEPLDPTTTWEHEHEQRLDKLRAALARANLKYVQGGRVVGGLSQPSLSLAAHIRKLDIESIDHE